MMEQFQKIMSTIGNLKKNYVYNSYNGLVFQNILSYKINLFF